MNMKEVLKNKFHKGDKSRGQGMFGIFLAIGIGLVIVAVILGIGAYLTAEIYKDMPSEGTPYNQTGSEYARNLSNKTLEAMNTAGSWLNIYVIVAIAVAIVGLIFMFTGVSGGRGRPGRGGARVRL